jgi:hypothetical protein
VPSKRGKNPDGKGRRRAEPKVVWHSHRRRKLLRHSIDRLAEFIATDLLRRIREGDESLLSERVGNELHVGLKSTSRRADGG